MRKYLFELEIEGGNDPFWDKIKNGNSTGCEEVVEMLEEHFYECGLMHQKEYEKFRLKITKLNLVRYTNEGF